MHILSIKIYTEEFKKFPVKILLFYLNLVVTNFSKHQKIRWLILVVYLIGHHDPLFAHGSINQCQHWLTVRHITSHFVFSNNHILSNGGLVVRTVSSLCHDLLLLTALLLSSLEAQLLALYVVWLGLAIAKTRGLCCNAKDDMRNRIKF